MKQEEVRDTLVCKCTECDRIERVGTPTNNNLEEGKHIETGCKGCAFIEGTSQPRAFKIIQIQDKKEVKKE